MCTLRMRYILLKISVDTSLYAAIVSSICFLTACISHAYTPQYLTFLRVNFTGVHIKHVWLHIQKWLGAYHAMNLFTVLLMHFWCKAAPLSLRYKLELIMFNAIVSHLWSSTLHALAEQESTRFILNAKHCTAKRPDVKSQIIHPRFNSCIYLSAKSVSALWL